MLLGKTVLCDGHIRLKEIGVLFIERLLLFDLAAVHYLC